MKNILNIDVPIDNKVFDIMKEQYINLRLSNLELRYQEKLKDIHEYLSRNNIKKVVIGFSGGADSTLVIRMLIEVRRLFDYFFEIHAFSIGFDGNTDTYENIDVEFIKSQQNSFQTNTFGNYFYNVNLPNISLNVSSSLPIEIQHQHNYAYRYTYLFTQAQLLGGITIGTTNSDELSYIGWFGKNSDMMVDLQFIADFHKFEIIYLLEDKFRIQIYDVPKGNLLDGKTDVECFGTDYDTLSFYSYCMIKKNVLFSIKSLDDLHLKNKHKYYGQTFNPYFIKNDEYFLLTNRIPC